MCKKQLQFFIHQTELTLYTNERTRCLSKGTDGTCVKTTTVLRSSKRIDVVQERKNSLSKGADGTSVKDNSSSSFIKKELALYKKCTPRQVEIMI